MIPPMILAPVSAMIGSSPRGLSSTASSPQIAESAQEPARRSFRGARRQRRVILAEADTGERCHRLRAADGGRALREGSEQEGPWLLKLSKSDHLPLNGLADTALAPDTRALPSPAPPSPGPA